MIAGAAPKSIVVNAQTAITCFIIYFPHRSLNLVILFVSLHEMVVQNHATQQHVKPDHYEVRILRRNKPEVLGV